MYPAAFNSLHKILSFIVTQIIIIIINFQSNARVKQLKRTMEETEDELSKEKMQRRKAQREVEDMMESQEAQNREISSLKTKLRYSALA